MSKEELTLEQLLERDAQNGKLDKITRDKESAEIAPEEMLLAELGLHYGFSAIMAVLNNEITGKQMNDLLAGARRISSQKRYNDLVDSYLAFAGTQSKKGASELKKHLREIIK